MAQAVPEDQAPVPGAMLNVTVAKTYVFGAFATIFEQDIANLEKISHHMTSVVKSHLSQKREKPQPLSL